MWRLIPLVLLAACIRTSIIPLGSRFAPVPEYSVRVFSTLDRVEGEYDEVAIISGEAGTLVSEGEVLAALRKKAGELGANAVVLDYVRKETKGAMVSPVGNRAVIRR